MKVIVAYEITFIFLLWADLEDSIPGQPVAVIN